MQRLVGWIQRFQPILAVDLDVGFVSDDKGADFAMPQLGCVRDPGDQNQVAAVEPGLHAVAVDGEYTVCAVHIAGSIEIDRFSSGVKFCGIAKAGRQGFLVIGQFADQRTALGRLYLQQGIGQAVDGMPMSGRELPVAGKVRFLLFTKTKCRLIQVKQIIQRDREGIADVREQVDVRAATPRFP